MRVLILLLDGCGVGELPDAVKYGDAGSSTISNVAKEYKALSLPNLQKLGLGNIVDILHVPPSKSPHACYGKLRELSPGKDSVTGHWELMGVILNKPFPTFPDGIPLDMINRFEKAINRKVIGGQPISGTVIIEQLGKEHIKTGYPIIYTSADSVFQIACHKDIMPLDELYRMCETARKLFLDIGRVIARPFTGKVGDFKRTPERKDYSLTPPYPTLLDILKDNGFPVVNIGKIDNLFGNRGFTDSFHTKNNSHGMKTVLNVMDKIDRGLIFTNLIDFDMLWGHRNNVEAFAKGLMDFDEWLPSCLEKLKRNDILVLTADHGIDPTTPSTDHSREYVPIIITGERIKKGIDLNTRNMSDLGASLAEYFGVAIENGISFLKEIIQD
ncbi:phosphopentomutase [candidate division WOR-3 bacterium]|nr:phosphopentomutase [candidate division WOR-3 bacterium]